MFLLTHRFSTQIYFFIKSNSSLLSFLALGQGVLFLLSKEDNNATKIPWSHILGTRKRKPHVYWEKKTDF